MAPWIRHGLPILALLSLLIPGNSAQGSTMLMCETSTDCPTQSQCNNSVCVCGNGNGLTFAGANGCPDPSPICPDPNPIDNGSHNTTGLSINDTVEYSCDPGYGIRSGGTTRTCESDGGWSGTAPVCENATDISNDCSYNSIKCHREAVCKDDYEHHPWECVCKNGLDGDGMLGTEHTGCGDISDQSCLRNVECHVEAQCYGARCVCGNGFIGNGWTTCKNIDECQTSTCSENAKCEDTVPGFRCTCLPSYIGNGFNCSHVCSTDYDCLPEEKKETCGGDGGVCICRNGFERNGAGKCVDIPECTRHAPCDYNADCEELIGSYRCTCRNGFRGTGKHCTELPLDCEQILAEKPTTTSGMYLVDVDGRGPLTAIMVKFHMSPEEQIILDDNYEVRCEMRHGRGKTLIYPVVRYNLKFYYSRLTHNYTYQQSLEHITALIDRSGYCFQDVRYMCKGGAVLMNGDYWLDRNGDPQYNWAGADVDNMCPCGQVGYCEDVGATCNCNGASTETRYDLGKLVNKDLLPLTQFFSDRTNELSGSRAYVRIGPVTCAAEHDDIPRSCHDAKFNNDYRIRYNGPQRLDFDGPGPLPPVLAHCDMESYPHVGITFITRIVRTQTEVTTPGEHSITYRVNADAARMLVNISEFCMQEAEYVCKNSRILNNGNVKGYFSTQSGEQADYWPGGNGQPNHCGCGVTHSCDQEDVLCNCDIMDGQTRRDFGVLTEKRLLPIGAVTFMDVGGTYQYGSYNVGPLKCGGQQFGIPRACDGYLYAGMTQSYAYLIDPDGPHLLNSNLGLLPPFLAYCKFVSDPPMVTTIINQYEQINGNSIYYNYYNVFEWEKLKALTDWSISCTQAVSYHCKGAPLFVDGQAVTTWQTINGDYRSYFAGDGLQDKCMCGISGTCEDANGACECDMGRYDSEWRSDVGRLTNKEDLPVAAIHVSAIAEDYNFTLGPLECRNMFPTCTEMYYYNKYNRPNTEQKLVDEAQFTVDPDGFDLDGVDPFVVTCVGSETTITVVTEPPDEVNSDPDSPTTKCFPVKYQDPNGKEITAEQVVKLIKKSKNCAQTLKKKCLNAPITNHTFYQTCDGVKQTAWAGSRSDDMCSCGATGSCLGGLACNCDNENGEELEDWGYIVDDDRVGVCKTCETLDPASGNNGEPDIRKAVIEVGDLVCDRKLPGGSGSSSCQDERNKGNTESAPINIDPDGSGGHAEPSPYLCVFKAFPPVSWMEVRPKNPHVHLPTTKITITIKYWTYRMIYLREVIERSSHCEQEISLDCYDSSLTLMNDEGLYSYNGSLLQYWAGNSAGNTSCVGGTCNCNSAGAQSDGVKITDKELLPISKVILGDAPGTRTLRIGPVVCYNLPQDCHEIKEKRLEYNLWENGSYVIDPDREGPLGYFPVECDFKTEGSMGITIVNLIRPPVLHPIRNQQLPGQYQRKIEYDGATYEQIRALSEISGFCQQMISYKCRKTALIGSDGTLYGFYNGYDGQPSTSFGDSDMVGCGCLKTHFCPPNSVCHCNGGPEVSWDYGFLLNGGPLPISQVNFGGQNASNSVSTYYITDVRCGPWPFDLPKHCQEAIERGFSSGEVMIHPANDVDPYLVYCEKRGNIGVTIIGNNQEGKNTVIYGTETFVEYHNANERQVDALVEISEHCYQPFRYDCFDTRFLVGENFFWTGGTTTGHELFVGDGRPYARECNCGRQGLCGGSEAKDILLQLRRSCNCDSADSIWRSDAGIFNKTVLLPIKLLEYKDNTRPNAMGYVTLGKLYCSQEPIDLNPCEMGFSDCHEHAKCSVHNRVSFKCRCKHGWNGYGVPNKLANGRNCYDDDECALHRCSSGSICTNLPGSFNCTCRTGFNQTSPTRCDDIDECETGSPCDPNADCHNRVGTYVCRCKWGYRGNGFTCHPVAECICFGDPHCISYDRKLLHYQGECEYTMTRDKCDDLSQTPTFEVISRFHERDVPMRGQVSWVKEILFNYMGHAIRLLQNHEVWVNGSKLNLPFIITNVVEVHKVGKYVEIFTFIGVRVYWDGHQEVKVEVPANWKNQTCGLCGNYNADPDDDFTIGPACPADMGNVTDNSAVFGNSWMTEAASVADATCVADCGELPETDECLSMAKHRSQFYCEIIWGTHSDFSDTLTIFDDWVRESYLESCVYDLCILGGDITDVLCDSVEAIAQQCEAGSRDAINAFLEENSCIQPCGENMEYVMCKSQTEMTCVDYLKGTMPSAPQPGTTSEGCYCRPEFYLDVDHCVSEDMCGCLHDGRYYSVGGQVVLHGCNSYAVCKKGNQMDISGTKCHNDAKCKIKEGVYGCHCDDGMYGDGVLDCHTDPCEGDVCGVDETCIRLPDNAVQNYYCQCSMGFMGDCGACEEIDECKTGTSDCAYHSECINTVGSFICECLDGFMMDAGECVDVDECAIDKLRDEGEPGLCVENARCSNKIGGYKCVCCQGYEWNNIYNKTECVASSSTEQPEQPEQPKCCICDIEICKRPGKVCGEDGITYNNMRDMIIQKCEEEKSPGQMYNVEYFGPCQQTCENDPCPLYQVCRMKQGRPTCDCEMECTEEDIEIGKVCDKNLKTWRNKCVFKQIMCHTDSETLLLPTMQPCDKKNGRSKFGEWSEFGPCSVTCGKGTRTRTRDVYGDWTPDQLAEFKLSDSENCYKPPCENGPCFRIVCDNEAAECVVNDEYKHECECPVCNEDVEDPICGFTSHPSGMKQSLWKSACILQRYACINGLEDYGNMYPGRCIDKPLYCARVPHSSEIIINTNNTKCHSLNVVNKYDCAGGCGRNKSPCCEPTHQTEREVKMVCDDESPTFKEKVAIINKCECTQD